MHWFMLEKVESVQKAGITLDGKPLPSGNGLVEIGHIPIGWQTEEEKTGIQCWCGQTNCHEVWVSGTGFQRDFQRRSGEAGLRSGSEIVALGTEESKAAYNAYCDRLARTLSVVVNLIDPHLIVLGGGMSRQTGLYKDVSPLMSQYVFSDTFETPIVPPVHGDSSGVRGAAWLW